MRSISHLARPEPVAAVATADDDNTAWLITFSDLVLQLFGFMLLATVMGNARRIVMPPPAPPAPAARVEARVEAPLPIAPPVIVEALPVIPAPPAPTPVASAPAEPEPVPIVAAAQVVVPETTPPVADVDALASQLHALAAAAGRPDGVALSVHDAEVVVTLSDTIGFPSGSADLLPGVVPILGAIRTLAASLPGFAVVVEGHTDDVQIHTAAFPSNLELSLARAARVARELSAGEPALVARTAASGFGEHRPLAANDEPAGRARNRRVEIRLVRHD